jgi:hypothetical protein
MKNILAENMLRFGVKNLSETSKTALQEQSEFPATTLKSKLTSVANWLDQTTKDALSKPVGTTYCGLTADNKYLVTYMTAEKEGLASGNGIFNVYTLVTEAGWPILKHVLWMINNDGVKWVNSKYTAGTNLKFDTLAGDNNAQKFNAYWSEPQYSDQIVKQKLDNFNAVILQLINVNIESLKKLFLENNSKMPNGELYSSEIGKPGITFKRSSYYITIDRYIIDSTARNIYNLINDAQLIQNLKSSSTSN